MPFPDVTGWGGPQSQQFAAAQPPAYIQDAINAGGFDLSKYRWNPDTMSLEGADGSYYFGNITDPANGTDVVTNLSEYNQTGTPQLHFGEGEQPFFGFGDGQETFISADPNAIDEWQHDRGTRTRQGIAAVGGLVGGAALGNYFTQPSTTAGAGNATVSQSLSNTGQVAGSIGQGGQDMTAVLAGGGGGGAAAGLGARVGNFLNNWGPELAGGVNALLGYRAADQAADAETAGLQAGIDEQRRQYDTTRQDLMPWMQAGQGALNNLQNPAASFVASPGYAWARSEGQRDIGNSFAARGGAASGNALKALSEFNTGLAQQDFGNWWNQQAGLAGVGQNATTNVANFGQNAAGNVGNYLANQGASRASGVLGKYGSIAGGANDALTNYLYRRRVA